MSGFENLEVWQKAKELAVFVYKTTKSTSFARDLGLTDQMRRSGVSVASNIAEGDERQTDKEAVRFFYIAKGSLAELRTQIRIPKEIDYFEEADFDLIEDKCREIGRMLGALIKHRGK